MHSAFDSMMTRLSGVFGPMKPDQIGSVDEYERITRAAPVEVFDRLATLIIDEEFTWPRPAALRKHLETALKWWAERKPKASLPDEMLAEGYTPDGEDPAKYRNWKPKEFPEFQGKSASEVAREFIRQHRATYSPMGREQWKGLDRESFDAARTAGGNPMHKAAR